MQNFDFVRNMKLAVNIGNTFDSFNIHDSADFKGWGNPPVTKDYIKALKSHGFLTVRLPVTWADHIGPLPDYTVNSAWISEIEKVVSWILEEGMYCIVNVHHDASESPAKSWIPFGIYKSRDTGDLKYEEEVFVKFTALWKQIAEKFNTASSKLIFEGMNEPQFDKIWNRYAGGQEEEKTKAFVTLNKLNQTFVDTVRSTGGNNSERFLLIPGYWTDFTNTIDNWGDFYLFPKDTMENALILSFHYYTPWDFCGGNNFTWGSGEEKAELDRLFDKVKTGILDKGIPVILGEYSVILYGRDGKAKDPAGRAAWMLAVTQKCLELGICPALWDTGLRPDNKGMGDIQREKPFGISNDLKTMLKKLL